MTIRINNKHAGLTSENEAIKRLVYISQVTYLTSYFLFCSDPGKDWETSRGHLANKR